MENKNHASQIDEHINLNDFFSNMNLNNFIVLFSVLDEASKCWGRFVQKKFLGLNINLKFRNSYIAVVDKRNSFVYESSDGKAISYNYKADNLNIHITSAGFGMQPFKSEIVINGIDYSRNLRGLNFVVIDNHTGEVIKALNCDLYADGDLTIDSDNKIFNGRLEKVMRGMQLAEKYCLYSNSVLYMILNRHIGDAARVLKAVKGIRDYYGADAPRYHFGSDDLNSEEARAKGIKKTFAKRKCIKKIVVITNQSISGVARLYSKYIDDIVVLSQNELNDIELYAYSGLGMHENIMTDQFPGGKLLGRWNFDEGSWVRWLMFGVNDTMWNLCMPIRLQGSECHMEVSSATMDKVNVELLKLKVDPTKLVILCPIAKSSSMLPTLIWEKFAAYAKNEGYKVYTNVGPNEKPISGTKELPVGIDEIVCLSNMGAKIVGVQCGLMDILSWAKCGNYVVLNPILNTVDITYARDVGCLNEVNKKPNNVTYLRIEHFEEDYVLKLLMDNFH
ncbi:MAG: hypothetical protein ACLSU0_03135 [Oscillospiraceae bacterium]